MFLSQDSLWVLVLALVLDALIGDPDAIWRRVLHPVVLMGRLIEALEQGLNDAAKTDAQRRAAGLLALAALVLAAAAIGSALTMLFRHVPYGSFIIAILASTLLAQRSLYQHIAHVRDAFAQGGLQAARAAVARVVGRDPDALDEAAICRAAIESCAENFSDGVVAPAFWFALCGLPGIIVYKIVNTADSMIGHRTERFEAFGWASARFDDLLNFLPARLSGALLALVAPVASGSILRAIFVMCRDARQHRSPNAGWPESAAAGALDLKLAGPRQYAGRSVDDPYLNQTGDIARPSDIARALRLLLAACGVEILVYVALALLV